MPEEIKKTAIDLFSGAGGLSLGAERAGIEVAVAVEKDKFSVETFKANHPKTKVLDKDIAEIDFSELELDSPFIIFGNDLLRVKCFGLEITFLHFRPNW